MEDVPRIPRRRLAVRFGKAMLKAAQAGFYGQRVFTPTEKFGERLNICQVCPKSVKRKWKRLGYQQCSTCGCTIRWKAALITEDCPEGKWPKISMEEATYGDENLARRRSA